jgi:hypothetical protein
MYESKAKHDIPTKNVRVKLCSQKVPVRFTVGIRSITKLIHGESQIYIFLSSFAKQAINKYEGNWSFK